MSTNVAAEFYVLSMLYRKGVNAHLTFGNRKAVDIVIENEDGSFLTVDVKGIKDMDNWPIKNFKLEQKNHFLVLVSFLSKMEDHSVAPTCWVIPSLDVKKLIRPYSTMPDIPYSEMKGGIGQEYQDRWEYLILSKDLNNVA